MTVGVTSAALGPPCRGGRVAVSLAWLSGKALLRLVAHTAGDLLGRPCARRCPAVADGQALLRPVTRGADRFTRPTARKADGNYAGGAGLHGCNAARGAWDRTAREAVSARCVTPMPSAPLGRCVQAAHAAVHAPGAIRFGGWPLPRLSHFPQAPPFRIGSAAAYALTHPGPTEPLPPGLMLSGGCVPRARAASACSVPSAEGTSGRRFLRAAGTAALPDPRPCTGAHAVAVRCRRRPSPAARSPRPGPPSARSSGWD